MKMSTSSQFIHLILRPFFSFQASVIIKVKVTSQEKTLVDWTYQEINGNHTSFDKILDSVFNRKCEIIECVKCYQSRESSGGIKASRTLSVSVPLSDNYTFFEILKHHYVLCSQWCSTLTSFTDDFPNAPRGIYIKEHSCDGPIEKLYYSCKYKPICIQCGDYLEDGGVDGYYPQCEECDDPMIKIAKSVKKK